MKLSIQNILFIVGALILLSGAAVYAFTRRRFVSVPGNGSDIPENWTPAPSAIAVHNSMSGLGTNTTLFFSTLEALTVGQRAVLYNYYNANLGNLIEDIKGDFSGIPGIGLRMPRSVASRFQRSIVS